MMFTESIRTSHQILKFLPAFNEVAANISKEEIEIFMMVANAEGLCMSDIGQALGFAVSTASRYFKNLSDYKAPDESGYGLLYNYRDPKNNRKRLVVLSPKGRALYERILGEHVLVNQKEASQGSQESVSTAGKGKTWGHFRVRTDRRSRALA
jgi:DNA-binding MarR family transcriptional regulator